MKKAISLIQMDSTFAKPADNFKKAEQLIRQAILQKPDIIVLPETWNVGFFPKENLATLADAEGKETQALLGGLASEYGINIVGGSVANLRDGKVFNTTYVYDRKGELVSSYDKIHGFTPSGEHEYFCGGTRTHRFTLDGIQASSVICYDIRFPEVIRTETLQGVDLFFVPAAWPAIRTNHWVVLNTARAIENQMYLCAVNGCGYAGDTKYGGNSLLISPWGDEILHLGEHEEIQTGEIDLDIIAGIRESINVFRDRKPKYYRL